MGPGPWVPGPRDPGTRDPHQSLKVGPGTPLKFKTGIPGPPSKFKSGTLFILFLHCLTYYVLDNFARILGILSYILYFEIIHHFCEIFNVTLSVRNATEGSFFLMVEGEIHATCLAS